MAGDEIESCTEWKVESSRTGNNSSRRTVKFFKSVMKIVKIDYRFQNDMPVEWNRFFTRLIRKKKNILVYWHIVKIHRTGGPLGTGSAPINHKLCCSKSICIVQWTCFRVPQDDRNTLSGLDFWIISFKISGLAPIFF